MGTVTVGTLIGSSLLEYRVLHFDVTLLCHVEWQHIPVAGVV